MHDTFGAHHFPAVRLADRLMPETDAENGDATTPSADRLDGYASFLGRAGTRRQHDGRRRQDADLVDGDCIVAAHDDFGSELTQVLNQVVGEGVVVVDDEQHIGRWLLVGYWYWYS